MNLVSRILLEGRNNKSMIHIPQNFFKALEFSTPFSSQSPISISILMSISNLCWVKINSIWETW